MTSARTYPVKEIQRVLWITLFLNLLVCGFKLVYGYMTQTLSMVADGYHSLLDSSSNIVGLTALAFAAKPPDDGHPYGHHKLEAVAAMVISALLFVACFEIASSAIKRIQDHVAPEVTVYSFIIMIGTMIINYFVSRYEHQKGEDLKSQILLADSAHTRSDVYASLSVIIALAGAKFELGWLDLLAAGFITLIVGYSGYKIVVEALNTLMDSAQLNPEEVIRLAKEVPGVHQCHHIRTRGNRSSVYMDLNIHVDPKLTTERAHEITHLVIAKIKEGFPQVEDVVIHTEPANIEHE